MNALNVPTTPEAIENVRQQLAISDAQQPPPPPMPPPLAPPSPAKVPAILDMTDPPRLPDRESIKNQGKASAANMQIQVAKAKSALNAANRVNAARQQLPPPPPPPPKPPQ